MLLDVLTERGTYVKKDGRWVRFALKHFRYNGLADNGFVVFVGFILLLVTYYITYSY